MSFFLWDDRNRLIKEIFRPSLSFRESAQMEEGTIDVYVIALTIHKYKERFTATGDFSST